MTTTLSIHEDTKQRFDDLRPESARSADEFLNTVLDAYEARQNAGVETPAVDGETVPTDIDEVLDASKADVPDTEEIVAALKDELSMANDPGVDIDTERLYKQLDELESRTGRIERLLEEVTER